MPEAARHALTERDAYREHGYVPMKDGTRLAYVMWRPTENGRYPTLLNYCAYVESATPFDLAKRYLEAGYAYVGANVRGTGASEGDFSYFQPIEGEDGAELIEWAAAQSWSTGDVGMVGGSYGGHTQITVAALRPPHLRAIVPMSIEGNEYRDEAMPGGLFNVGMMAHWAFDIQPARARTCIEARVREGDADASNRRVQPVTSSYGEALQHPLYDDWWRARALDTMADRVTVPALFIQGWQDEWIGPNGVIRLFKLLSSRHKKLLLQNGPHRGYPINEPEQMRWLNRWVKGEDNGVDAEPPVTVLWEIAKPADGALARPGWVTTYPAWPVPDLQWVMFYLTAAGELSREAPAATADHGMRSYVCPLGTELVGSTEQFALAPYPLGTLSYRTPPMTEDTALLGSPLLTFFFSIDRTDTDFMFTLKDIDSVGNILFLQRSVLRASLRAVDEALSTAEDIVQSFAGIEELVPGEIYEVRLSLSALGHVVRAGHRLELSILAPNQTPGPIWSFVPAAQPSINKIYHSETYPSNMRLPVVLGERAQKPAPDWRTLENQPYRTAPGRSDVNKPLHCGEHGVSDHSETFKSGAPEQELQDLSVSRRSLMQSVPAIVLGSVTSGIADSADALLQKQRQLRIDQKFVLFPINNEALSRHVRVAKNGRVLRSFTASLGLPAHWWAHLDVSEWQGEMLTLSIEPDNAAPIAVMEIAGRGASETNNAELVAAVRTSAEIWSPETLYREPLRPLFHFTSKRGWNNDPNGLLYHAGQYHLFFQHNPYGVRWGNMHWGHAVSTDLVHWKELPIALYPRGEDDFPYSGSGVVDHDNTSGWGKNGRPPMVIAFTSTGRGECIAYSQDDGATWKEFEGNPVVKHDGRDPRLLWHPQTKQWVMAVYSERLGADAAAPQREGIAFYTSSNLKSWQERSWIEGYFECPDLFALPVDGNANRMKWVLSGAPSSYCIGEFDGARFIPESPQLPAPAGGNSNVRGLLAAPFPLFYAAQTFSDHPEGHRAQIAWARVEAADAPFTQMMSFPTTLSLRTTSEGVRLCREPVDAIRSLRIQTYDFPAGPLTTSPLLAQLKGEAWDIETVIKVGTVSPILMSIGGDEYVYQTASQMLSGPKGAVPIPLDEGRLRLRILVDKTTVEIFGDRGQAYGMFVRGTPGGNVPLELRPWNRMWGEAYVEKLSAHSLRSAWTA